jgi:hypothetical protein
MIDVTNLPDGFYQFKCPLLNYDDVIYLCTGEKGERALRYRPWSYLSVLVEGVPPESTLTPLRFVPLDGVVKTPGSSTIVINISEKHVEEKILGYITRDAFVAFDQQPRKELMKVVERKYRHPAAPEHAFLMRTEVVSADDNIPPELKDSVHVLAHMEDAMLSLMNKHCQE